MTQIEKMELFIKVMKGEVEIEYKGLFGDWYLLTWKETTLRFSSEIISWSISELLADDIEIRIVPKLPLLTEEDCDYLKWYPKDLWIFKNRDGDIRVTPEKPYKGMFRWEIANGWNELISLFGTMPKLEGLKWENEDCYTIGELVEYSKEYRKQK